MGKVNQVAIADIGEGTFKFSKIYLEGSEAYESYTSNYLLVNGKEIPFLDRNTNQYAGESITLTDDDLQIKKDGRDCINLEKIKQLVKNGYYPTDSALKEWSKWADSDGYFSDWIVTLTQAQRIDDGDTPGDDDDDDSEDDDSLIASTSGAGSSPSSSVSHIPSQTFTLT